ncbi:MAG TPA: hypothetical protein PLV85_13880, partial [Polyangiaceae bacterium]|nr:hypothetical protein [Polyangiaceae bacterium]
MTAFLGLSCAHPQASDEQVGSQQQPLSSEVVTTIEPGNGQTGVQFGTAVALDGIRLAVGQRGAVSVYEIQGTSLSAPVEVKPQNCPASNFGESIAIDGDTMVIGAPGVSADQTEGVEYVYVRAGSTWVEQAQLAVPSLPLNTRFGHAVAVSGNTVVVGAPDSSNDRSGSAHVFVYQYGG